MKQILCAFQQETRWNYGRADLLYAKASRLTITVSNMPQVPSEMMHSHWKQFDKGELLMCVPHTRIFTSRGKTIKRQEKPQESGLRFIRLGVKPSSMQEAKKDLTHKMWLRGWVAGTSDCFLPCINYEAVKYRGITQRSAKACYLMFSKQKKKLLLS